METIRIFALTLAFTFSIAAHAQSYCSNRQTQQEIDARLDALIAQMTVAERIAQLQDRAPAIPRLGLPAYNWWNEGLHGIARNGYATVFPQAIGLAATWDAVLMHSVGYTVSTEARSKFNPHRDQDSPRYAGITIWSPNINIFRDPRWGRGQETYGEDPFLTATLGTAFVDGLQGEDPFYRRADATPKHFVAHSGPEVGRDSFNASVSQHDLADTFLPAFHALITEAKAGALMCSYNAIDGTPSCANRLLEQTVRDAWQFRGYVVSDCDAVGNISSFHHYAPDAVHAAATALNAGVDLDCGHSYLPLGDALRQHLTTEADIDRALHRLLLARVHLGLLDPVNCTSYSRITAEQNDTSAHRALALRAAQESIVLLHNHAALPLRRSDRVAVVGPNADSLAVLEANYHGTASHPVTELDGLKQVFPDLHYAQGSLLAEGVPAPVPRTALRTSTATGASAGLRAEYFGNTSFSGVPVTRISPTVELDLDRVAPSPQIDPAHYSARWTGEFVPPAPGTYSLHVAITRCGSCTTHDRFRLYIDGAIAIENGGKAEPSSFALQATTTQPHSLRLELIHAGGDEGIALEWLPPAEALIEEAEFATHDADTIIAFVGLSPALEGEALPLHLEGFNGGDRTSLDLPDAQRQLLLRLHAIHKRLVIVLNSGSAVAINPADYGADALLAAWYPGEAGGTAVADVLTGKVSASGRLPVTFYRSVKDLPSFTDYSMQHRTYRYFAGPVLYPFGFGLTDYAFHYGRIHIRQTTLEAGTPLSASVTIRNPGNRMASEVAELYLVPPATFADGLTGAPRLLLVGFTRVKIEPKQSRTLNFTISARQLSLVDPSGHRTVRSGLYRLFVGSGQPPANQYADPRAGSPFSIAGEKDLEDVPPQTGPN